MAKSNLLTTLKDYDKYLSFADDSRERKYYKSGVLAINHIIADNGGLGIPGGTMLQLLGEPKHGKSTISLDYIAMAQEAGLNELEISDGKKGSRMINAAILDFETSFDPKYAELIGVDLSKLLIVKTRYAEESFNIAEALLSAGLQMLVVDSVGMLVSATEEDKDYDDSEKIASEAKVLGRFLKRANALLDLSDGLMIVINQYRANLSQMSRSDKKPYGARLLQYAVKATMKVTRTETKGGRGETEVMIEKTKFGPEALKTRFSIEFGYGIDYTNHILTLAREFGIIETAKSWYYYGDLKAQGLENCADVFPIDEITEKVSAALLTKGVEE